MRGLKFNKISIVSIILVTSLFLISCRSNSAAATCDNESSIPEEKIQSLYDLVDTEEVTKEIKEETITIEMEPIVGVEPIIEIQDEVVIKNPIEEIIEEELETPEPKELEIVIPSERVIDPNRKMVCLTFDDGPSKANTERIVDLLNKYGAKASFFEVGSIAEKNEDLVLYEFKSGNEICNHSYSHLDMSKASNDEVISEITKTNDILKNITGCDVKFVRPPYGSLNKDALYACNMSSILWSVDTRDWSSRNVDKIMNVIKSEETLDGAVILMHSSYSTSADALEELLPYLYENDYQMVTLSEMYALRYQENPEAGKIYGYTYFIKQRSKNPSN